MTLVQIPKLTTTLEDFLKNLESIEPLFDALSSVVFFIKNTEARYVFVNQTLVNRCGLKDKTAILGKTSSEVFPHSLGKIYTSQEVNIENLPGILNSALEIHKVNAAECDYLINYALGEQPILKRKKEVREEIKNNLVINNAFASTRTIS